jgi:phage minor structural protein
MILLLNKDETVKLVIDNDLPEALHYYEDFLTEELDSFKQTYEFKVPENHEKAALLKEGASFVIRGLDDEFLMFRIEIIRKGWDEQGKYVYVYAETAGLELLKAVCRPINLISVSAERMLNNLLAGTGWQVGTVEVSGTNDLTVTDYTTTLEQMPVVASLFSGALRYRVEVENNKISGRYVDLLTRRGADRGKRFDYHKDIQGLTKTVDITNVFTALVGVGAADESGNFMTFASVVKDGYDKPLGQDWIGDNDALQLYGVNGKHLMGYYKVDNAENKIDLLQKTYEKLQEVKTPVTTYDVQVILLGQLLGLDYEDVRLGDTVGITDFSMSEEIFLEARINQLKTSFTAPEQSAAVLSDYVPKATNINKQMKDIQSQLQKNAAAWNQANTANNKASSGIYESGVHKDAKAPVFTRNTTLTYKGNTYAVNEPVFDYNGIMIDPEAGEDLTIYTSNVLYADEGTIELKITPLKMMDFNNYLRMEYNSSSRFLLYTNAAGRIYFSIDNWGAGYVRTDEGVLQLNKPVSVAVRWSDKSKTYSLFVNGQIIGTNYYDKAAFGEFPATMDVVYNYASVISDLRISKVARGDVEIMKG